MKSGAKPKIQFTQSTPKASVSNGVTMEAVSPRLYVDFLDDIASTSCQVSPPALDRSVDTSSADRPPEVSDDRSTAQETRMTSERSSVGKRR
jgi:hypothetical protein